MAEFLGEPTSSYISYYSCCNDAYLSLVAFAAATHFFLLQSVVDDENKPFFSSISIDLFDSREEYFTSSRLSCSASVLAVDLKLTCMLIF